MRVCYVAPDGKQFDTEAACLRHEKESLVFRGYDREGRPTEVGHGVHLLHIIVEGEGGEAFRRLCEEQDEDNGLIDYCSSAGWYWWDDYSFTRVDEELIRAMMRARYNIDIVD